MAFVTSTAISVALVTVGPALVILSPTVDVDGPALEDVGPEPDSATTRSCASISIRY